MPASNENRKALANLFAQDCRNRPLLCILEIDMGMIALDRIERLHSHGVTSRRNLEQAASRFVFEAGPIFRRFRIRAALAREEALPIPLRAIH